jgi:hypothetical protein
VSSTSLPVHDAYAREILHHLQQQHEEKNRFLNAERQKEIARLHAEQKELEKQARLHAEVVRKEQELMRLREAEKKRKELSKIEEASRQQELYRLQEIREKERQDERNLAELKTKEDIPIEFEKLPNFERKKELPQKQKYEQNNEHKITRTETQNSQTLGNNGIQSFDAEQPEAQSLVRESQLHHQHLTEVTNKNTKESRPRVKSRNKLSQYHQQDIPESTESQSTTPSPNQPPLSIYVGANVSNYQQIQLTDVLKTLNNARTIDVIDNFGSNIPNLFVGPRYLDPPTGYTKFNLPYLSSIESSHLERKVDKLPFFVAPLSFDPPIGFSKIPFPAPHIGSVIINSLENIEPKLKEKQNNNTLLIESNSYFMNNQPVSNYETNTPGTYLHKSSTSRYDVSTLPPTELSTKWRFKEIYESKPSTEVPSVITESSYNGERLSNNKFEYSSIKKNYYNLNDEPTTPGYYSPKTVSIFSFEQAVPQSTPVYQEKLPINRNTDHQLFNSNIDPNQQELKTYHNAEQYEQTNGRFVVDPNGHPVTNTYHLNSSPNYEEDDTQYNLSAQLPAISPQLPGLVNALVEKSEVSSTYQPPTTTVTTTTTNATDVPTTYRSRTRHR